MGVKLLNVTAETPVLDEMVGRLNAGSSSRRIVRVQVPRGSSLSQLTKRINWRKTEATGCHSFPETKWSGWMSTFPVQIYYHKRREEIVAVKMSLEKGTAKLYASSVRGWRLKDGRHTLVRLNTKLNDETFQIVPSGIPGLSWRSSSKKIGSSFQKWEICRWWSHHGIFFKLGVSILQNLHRCCEGFLSVGCWLRIDVRKNSFG